MKQARTYGSGTEREKQKKPATEEAFRAFHKKNPIIYDFLVLQVRLLKKIGINKCNFQAVYECTMSQVLWSVYSKMELSFVEHYRKLILEDFPDMKNFLI